MDRRNFLKTSAFCIGVSTITAAGRRKETAEKVSTPLEVMGYVTEPAKQLPLIASADIVVVGGGPAGVSAAVSAAGIAAALAEARRTSIQDVDINLLQNTLVSRGAKIR